MNSQDLPVIGWVELVDLPEYGLLSVPAKIDTGAYSGALHCKYEKIIEDAGEKWLEYQPLHSEEIIRTKDFVKKLITSSNGKTEERHKITTTIIVHGKQYPLQITLSDRSNMTYDVILGRYFLAGKFLINPEKSNGMIRSNRL